MAAHVCEACGMLHDSPTLTEANDVAIARIQAEAQVRIAELQARADKNVAEAYAEADVESAKAESKAIQAAYADQEADEHVVEAINAVSAGLDPVEDEPAPVEPMPMPEIVNVNENDDVTVPPKREESEPPKQEPKKKGLGWW